MYNYIIIYAYIMVIPGKSGKSIDSIRDSYNILSLSKIQSNESMQH